MGALVRIVAGGPPFIAIFLLPHRAQDITAAVSLRFSTAQAVGVAHLRRSGGGVLDLLILMLPRSLTS